MFHALNYAANHAVKQGEVSETGGNLGLGGILHSLHFSPMLKEDAFLLQPLCNPTCETISE